MESALSIPWQWSPAGGEWDDQESVEKTCSQSAIRRKGRTPESFASWTRMFGDLHPSPWSCNMATRERDAPREILRSIRMLNDFGDYIVLPVAAVV